MFSAGVLRRRFPEGAQKKERPLGEYDPLGVPSAYQDILEKSFLYVASLRPGGAAFVAGVKACLCFFFCLGESNRPLTPILLKSIANGNDHVLGVQSSAFFVD